GKQRCRCYSRILRPSPKRSSGPKVVSAELTQCGFLPIVQSSFTTAFFEHQKLRLLAVAGQYQSALLLTNWSDTGLEWHLHAANWFGYTAVTQLPTMRVGTSEGVGDDSSSCCYRRGTVRPRPIAGVPAGEAKKCGHSGDR